MAKLIQSFVFCFLSVIGVLSQSILWASDLNSLEKSQTAKMDTEASQNLKKSLMNSPFVLETDQGSAAESLERISGKIDLGFSAPENTYKTEERPGAGPFAKEKAEAKKQGNANY